jgi:hypothetical protein
LQSQVLARCAAMLAGRTSGSLERRRVGRPYSID